MLELLSYMRSNGFKTFIVSGGGIEFMRPWVEQVYGIPPEQVVGSSGRLKYELRDGKPVLVKLPELNFIDDKDGKSQRLNCGRYEKRLENGLSAVTLSVDKYNSRSLSGK